MKNIIKFAVKRLLKHRGGDKTNNALMAFNLIAATEDSQKAKKHIKKYAKKYDIDLIAMGIQA